MKKRARIPTALPGREEVLIKALVTLTNALAQRDGLAPFVFQTFEQLSHLGVSGRVYIYQTLLMPWLPVIRYQQQLGDTRPGDMAAPPPYFEQWASQFYDKQTIHGPTHSFPTHKQKILTQNHLQAVIIIPIHSPKTLWGLLGLEETSHVPPWSPAEINQLQAIAALLATAIQSIHLQATTQQHILSETTLLEASLAISSSLDLTTILQRLAEAMGRAINATSVYISDWQPESQKSTVLAEYYGPEALSQEKISDLGVTYHVPTDFQASLQAIQEAKSLIMYPNDPHTSPAENQHLLNYGAKAVLIVPVIGKSGVVGTAEVWESRHERQFLVEELTLCEGIARQAAIAIENARIYQMESKRRQQAESLIHIAAKLVGTFDLDEVLNQAITSVRQFISQANNCAISILEQNGTYLRNRVNWSDRPEHTLYPAGEGNQLHHTFLSKIAIESQKTLILNNLAEHLPQNAIGQEWLLAQKVCSIIYIPLVVQNRSIGLLHIHVFDTPYQFEPDEIAICEAIGHHAAIAIENARLYQAEAHRRHQAEILTELTNHLISTTNLEALLTIAVASIHQFIPATQNCAISILEENQKYLHTTASWSAKPDFEVIAPGARYLLNATVSSRYVLQHNEPVTISDLSQQPQAKTNLRTKLMLAYGLRALLYVPLQIRGRAIGVFHVNIFDQPYYFQPDEIALCCAVANQVAIAIENARLFEAQRSQLRLSQTLQQVGSLLTTSLSLNELYETLFDLLAQVVAYDSVSITIVNELDEIEMVAGRGFADFDAVRQTLRGIPAGRINRFSIKKRYAVIPDTYNDPRWVYIKETAYSRSWIGAGLFAKDHFLGILNLDSKTPNAYDENSAATVDAFANQAAIALDNARLYEETRQRADELAILYELSLATAHTVKANELIDKTIQTIAQTLYPVSFAFALLEEKSGQLLLHPTSHGVPAATIPQPIPLDHSIMGLVIHSGRPKIVNDVRKETHYHSLDNRIRSEVCVPLVIRGQVVGVINAESDQPHQFSLTDVRFLTTLAGQVAIAIERTQLYENLQRYASHLAQEVAARTQELQTERDRTLAILEAAGEGVVLTNLSGHILYINPAMERLSGYSREECHGQPSRLFGSGLTPEHLYREMWQTINSGNPWHGELINKHKSGAFYDVSITITPLFDTNHQLSGFVAIESDISRFKEVERLKSDFITNVSHELRTPLTNIRTYVSLLARTRPERWAHYLKVIHDETERLTRLIEDLLDLSRLESGKTSFNLQWANLRQLIDEVLDVFEVEFKVKEMKLVVNVPAGLPPLWCSPSHVVQVITNLIANALAYTPAGGQIGVTAGQDEPEMVWFQISDTGTGIAPEEMPRLFERFFRGRAANQSRSPGTGLGLAISKEIVAQLGGEIGVASQPEQGTTFTIWLPTSQF